MKQSILKRLASTSAILAVLVALGVAVASAGGAPKPAAKKVDATAKTEAAAKKADTNETADSSSLDDINLDDLNIEAVTGKKANLRENSYYYGAFNRRDPFKQLVDGSFVRDAQMETIDLTGVELVGVVRGELDRFALLEDEKGFTYILRVGDRVRNGSVVAIGDETLTARISTFGQTSNFTLHMVQRQKGDKR